MKDLNARSFRRAAITTLGCKINSFESALIGQKLKADKWIMVPSKEAADLYVINSCTVTAEAGRQTRQEIRRAIARNPSAFIVVTGCYAEMEESSCAEIPGVDLVVANNDKFAIAEHVRAVYEKRPDTAIVRSIGPPIGLEKDLLPRFSGRSRAFVQVQQGCDQGCTFCIIHQARGRSRSFPFTQVLNQIRLLVSQEYKEIIICGVDLGSWGQDIDLGGTREPASLVQLLEQISELPGDFRIRLSSIDPIHLEDNLIELMASNSRFCDHLHVSIQSANEIILKRMKRRYGPDWLYERIYAAYSHMPGLILSADLMVGFPTETDAQFEDTLRAVDDLKIVYPHVFPYSPRRGTPAARIPTQIPKRIRKERSRFVRDAGSRILKDVLAKQIGDCGRVLIERPKLGSSVKRHGRLDNYLPVLYDGPEGLPGSFCKAHIIGVSDDVLIAEQAS